MLNKKTSLLSIIIIILIGTLALLYQNYSTKDIKNCNNLKNTQDQNECLIKVAVKKDDAQLCDDFKAIEPGVCKRMVYINEKNIQGCQDLQKTNPLDSEICLSGIAKANNDINLCNELTLESTKDSCIFNVGINAKDTDTCNLIGDKLKKEFCFIKLAQNLNNLQICENIQTENEIKLCFSEYKLVTKENLNCNDLTDSYKTVCSAVNNQ